MSSEPAAGAPAGTAARPGLIWGFAFEDGRPRPLDDIDLLRGAAGRGFRWLHFNLADLRTQRWLADQPELPPAVRELLTAPDDHQRMVVEAGFLAGVLQDIERDFDEGETRIGAVRFAVGPSLAITARSHPLRSGDLVRQRIAAGVRAGDAASALELLLGSIAEVVRTVIDGLDDQVQALEEALLKDDAPPDTRELIGARSLMARLHRMLSGMRTVLNRLDDDQELASAFRPAVLRATGRLATLDAELLSIQSQLRLLREELDLQATQRTNQNLYILSMLTALMLPATLVTGVFGMNTGGLPLHAGRGGTFAAVVLAVGASLAVYVWLRVRGFIRR